MPQNWKHTVGHAKLTKSKAKSILLKKLKVKHGNITNRNTSKSARAKA